MSTHMNGGSPQVGNQTTGQDNQNIPVHRSERRIAVHLPLKLRCRDERGVTIEEDTSSENVCRSGAAFVMRSELAIGADVEIRIPFGQYASRRSASDFETRARVVHIGDSPSRGEKLVGVQFTGPRFQRVFRSESVS